MKKPKVYPGWVDILIDPFDLYHCRISTAEGVVVFQGDEYHDSDSAIREAASWLESYGYIHPLTHEIAR